MNHLYDINSTNSDIGLYKLNSEIRQTPRKREAWAGCSKVSNFVGLEADGVEDANVRQLVCVDLRISSIQIVVVNALEVGDVEPVLETEADIRLTNRHTVVFENTVLFLEMSDYSEPQDIEMVVRQQRADWQRAVNQVSSRLLEVPVIELYLIQKCCRENAEAWRDNHTTLVGRGFFREVCHQGSLFD